MSNDAKIIGEIMAKCWADERYKQKLLADANAVLTAEGVKIPAGVTIHVVENTDKVLNYVLPRNPKAELSDADLDAVAGGKGCGFTCEKEGWEAVGLTAVNVAANLAA